MAVPRIERSEAHANHRTTRTHYWFKRKTSAISRFGFLDLLIWYVAIFLSKPQALAAARSTSTMWLAPRRLMMREDSYVGAKLAQNGLNDTAVDAIGCHVVGLINHPESLPLLQ